MAKADGTDAGSRLQKVVEVIAITPEAAHQFVNGYRQRFQEKTGRLPNSVADKSQIAKKIIRRYASIATLAEPSLRFPGPSQA